MTSSFRLRSFRMLPALCVGALGLLASCTDEPLPRATQTPEERLLAPLIGRRHNPFIPSDVANGPDSTAEWEGKWILVNHMLTLQATHLPPGKLATNFYLFGYSPLAKRYYMVDVIAGGDAPDRVKVSWFEIAGRTWRFSPVVDTIDGKPVFTRRTWDSGTHIMSMTEISEDSAQVSVPPPRAEMALYSGWVGRWPDRHEEAPYTIDGVFDSKLVGGGSFLVWFENNVVTDHGKGTTSRERVVRIWGFNDVPHTYYRVDVGTGLDGHPITPRFRQALSFLPYDGGLAVAAPLYSKDAAKKIPSRYVVSRISLDTMVLYEQYLAGGITWTNTPGAVALWGKLK